MGLTPQVFLFFRVLLCVWCGELCVEVWIVVYKPVDNPVDNP